MIVGDIYTSSDIIKVQAGDSLSSALNKLSSSHDAAFVFNNGEFLGVVTPYFSSIKTAYPPQTNVEHALTHPPKTTLNDDITHVAQLMIEAKMHYLPVFDNNQFVGVVNARRILSALAGDVVFKQKVGDVVGTRQRLVTIAENDPISKAIAAFKKYGVSKLVVIDNDMKLKGIIAQYDLIDYLIVPKNRQSFGALGGEKKPQHNSLVKNLYKTNVLTMTSQDTFEKARRLIVEKQKGSVVLVDQNNHPVEIVTIQDLLICLIKQRETIPLDVVVRHIESSDKPAIDHFLEQLASNVKYLDQLVKVDVTIEEQKHGAVVEIMVIISYRHKGETVIKKTGKNIAYVTSDILEAVNTLASKK